MSRKSIDHKIIAQFTRESLAEGKSRQQIYNELTEKYFDRFSLKQMVDRVPDPRLLIEHKKEINFSIGLVTLSFLSFSAMLVLQNISIHPAMTISYLVLLLVFILYAIFSERKYILEFGLIPLIVYINLSFHFNEFFTIEPILFTMSILFGIFYIISAIRLRRKLLPHLRFFKSRKNQSSNV
jgi:hypothetical protein